MNRESENRTRIRKKSTEGQKKEKQTAEENKIIGRTVKKRLKRMRKYRKIQNKEREKPSDIAVVCLPDLQDLSCGELVSRGTGEELQEQQQRNKNKQKKRQRNERLKNQIHIVTQE